MCDISDSYTSSPAVQFRNKLLHAILDLQEALNMSDLGLLHPVPYKDTHGAIVFAITQYLKVREGGGREGGKGEEEGRMREESEGEGKGEGEKERGREGGGREGGGKGRGREGKEEGGKEGEREGERRE